MKDVSHEFIKGKSCIVVAPSRYLRGRGSQSAEFIDSFDLVVKTTDMCEMRDPVGELGKRCDVWYGMPGNASGWRVNIDALEKQGVKLMVFQPCLEKYRKVWNEYLSWFEEQPLPEGLQYEFADVDEYQRLIETFDSLPLSGIFAVFDLLKKGAKRVFAYGHDFYHSGYFFDSDFQAKTQISDWHKLEKQMAATWELYQNDSRFECDVNLQYLMRENFQADFDAQLEFSQLIKQELAFFNGSFPFGNTVLIRTCNITWFNRILAELAQPNLLPSLDVIAQQTVTVDLPVGAEHINTHNYLAGDKFCLTGLQAELDFAPGKFETAIVPYNGLELWTYLDVFKYFLALEVKNVFLISTRGTVRRVTDLENECQSIEEYLSLRNKIHQYAQRYDRRNCI